MSESERSSILKYSELLIDCFFELLSEGLLSDKMFEDGIQSPDSFKKVKEFRAIDFSHEYDSFNIQDGALCINVIEKITEKLNDYLHGIGSENFSQRLSEFDEEISEDNFLRTVENIPTLSPLFNFFHLIWECTFGRLSCFEKSISFANDLHSESTNRISEHYDLIKGNIDDANSIVDKLNKQIYGHEGNVGLVEKIEETEEKIDSIRNEIQSSTVTILGIFAAIVLAFSGVFSFSSSIMQNMGSVSIYRLIGVSVILGLVSFNLIFCLIKFLLIGTSKAGTKKMEASETNITKRNLFTPMWVTDGILLLLLLFVVIAWSNDWLTKSEDLPDLTASSIVTQIQANGSTPNIVGEDDKQTAFNMPNIENNVDIDQSTNTSNIVSKGS